MLNYNKIIIKKKMNIKNKYSIDLSEFEIFCIVQK